MVEMNSNWFHSVHMKETRSLTEEVIEKGTVGLVISSEVRGPTPGANVLFGEKEEVRWVPLEFMNIQNMNIERMARWSVENVISQRP